MDRSLVDLAPPLTPLRANVRRRAVPEMLLLGVIAADGSPGNILPIFIEVPLPFLAGVVCNKSPCPIPHPAECEN
jgi:hypothetical protein